MGERYDIGVDIGGGKDRVELHLIGYKLGIFYVIASYRM